MHQNNVTQHVLELKQCITLDLYGTTHNIILLCKHYRGILKYRVTIEKKYLP